MMAHYIIIGAGSAGCVLANRLSKNPENSVLLLEAGGPADNPEINIPGRWSKLLKTDIDWSYQSEPQAHLNNRRIDLNRGKVVGGTTAINGMIYIRGHRWDYDNWVALGNDGWGFDEVLPYFKKAEGYEGTEFTDVYGTDGPLSVARIPDVLGQTERFVSAGEMAGLTRNDEFNGGVQDGVGPYKHNYKDGQRVTLADAYLKPVLGRDNLEIKTHAHATRILFEDGRAVSVEYVHENQLKQARAEQEIILCGGAINSPQLLLCSGIGPATQLQQLGIPVVANLPGVGENLQDHPLLPVQYAAHRSPRVDASLSGQHYQEFLQHKAGPLITTRTFAGAFWRTQPDIPAPDMQVFFSIGELHDTNDFAIALCLMRPDSRGHVRLRAADPFVYPAIQPNYLAEPLDMQVYIDSVRIARRIAATAAFDGFVSHELEPGIDAQSDAEIAAWVRDALVTTWHYSGTCKMGVDSMAVVDPQLRVRGMNGIRVVDASAMPEIVTGNINAATIMIAEKAADMIIGGQYIGAQYDA